MSYLPRAFTSRWIVLSVHFWPPAFLTRSRNIFQVSGPPRPGLPWSRSTCLTASIRSARSETAASNWAVNLGTKP
jgi:hypothetical protein